MEATIQPADIEEAKRMGPKKANKIRDILVKFTCKKDEFYKHRKMLTVLQNQFTSMNMKTSPDAEANCFMKEEIWGSMVESMVSGLNREMSWSNLTREANQKKNIITQIEAIEYQDSDAETSSAGDNDFAVILGQAIQRQPNW